MKVISDWPPNINEIKQVLPINEKIVYCYGDKIYVPDGHEVEPEILYHESIHKQQQGDNPKEWWLKYFFVKKHTSVKRSDIELEETAQALSGKEYGNLISFHEAKTLIRYKAKQYDTQKR